MGPHHEHGRLEGELALGLVVRAHDVTRHTGTRVAVDAAPGLTQRFLARDDRLTAVSIWVAARREPDASPVRFALLEGAEERVVREGELRLSNLADNAWARVPFEPVPDSRGRSYAFRLEARGGGGLELWSNSGAVCHRTHYRRSTHAVLDPLLSRYARYYPETTAENREVLHEILRYGVRRDHALILHLVHLLDAFNRTQRVRRVLCAGSGPGHLEVFLAARFPEIRVDVAGGRSARAGPDFPNLLRLDLDLADSPDEAGYDFVFAVGRLEGAAEPRSAFRNLAAKARPGGWLYFAESNGALDLAALYEYFLASRYDVVHEASTFDGRLIRPLEELRRVVDPETTERELEAFLGLFLLDLGFPSQNAPPEPGGFKCLGRRRAGSPP